jgi:arylformamidase
MPEPGWALARRRGRVSLAIYDVSVPLRPGMPTWDGEPGPVLEFHARMGEGGYANISALSLGSHTGTHVDAPLHFLEGGPGVEAMPLEALAGPACVVEHSGPGHIGAVELAAAGVPADVRRVLMKTANGRFWDDDAFHRDFTALALDGARWLIERRCVLVGIDYLSIEEYGSKGNDVHRALLAAGVVIVEGLDLRAVPPGRYNMACAPLKVVGADGAPARVFLWD